MRSQTPQVLISGGGIAGPALALWLHRRGFAPTIVERAPSVRAGGHRIQIEGVGVEVLHRMGVLDRVREESGAVPSAITLGIGSRSVPVDIRWEPAEPLERSGVVIKRGVLCKILYEQVRGTTEYLFGDSIAELHQDSEGVAVAFENGEPRRFDLVIGADGLHSNVRSLVFGPETRFTHYLGTNLALFTADNDMGVGDRILGHSWPYRGALISSFPGHRELEGLFLIRSREPMDATGLTPEEVKNWVGAVFAGDGWRVPCLRDLMHRARYFHFAPSTQIRMDRWSEGRVALVGDSAYCPDPMTGQGTTLALVGAYVLAGELAAARGEHRTAFSAYESAMRDFAALNHALGGEVTAMAAPRTTETRLWLQAQVYRAVSALAAAATRAGLRFPSRWDAAQSFPLKGYERV